MSRVTESSSFHAIKHSVAKTKERLEDLQIQGSNLKRVQKPSDDPMGNIEILAIRSKKIDGDQYQRNASVAKAQLTFTEAAIEELTEILSKAKELAIGQASNLFDVNVRHGVAKEVEQLRNQAISIGNRRIGNKYIFGGFKSLSRPFDQDGKYLGDDKQTKIEVGKDFYVPVNFNGKSIFFDKDGTAVANHDPLNDSNLPELGPNLLDKDVDSNSPADDSDFSLNRTPANEFGEAQGTKDEARGSIFSELSTLHNALMTNNHEAIQDLLPSLDNSMDRLIAVRTQVGSFMNSIESSNMKIEKENLANAEYKSKIEDADIAELFTDLTRQQSVLDATYKASAQLMNKNLMNYIS